jgi:isochorismate synthase
VIPSIGRARDEGSGLRRVVLPLAAVSLEALFDALPAEDAIYWAEGAETIVGLGAARVLTASGERRFAAIRDQAASLPAWARLYSAFAFSPARGPTPLPDAWAILPRFLVRRRGGEAQLQLTLDGAVPPEALSAFLLALSAARATPTDGAPARVSPEREDDDFSARVARTRDRIVRGELDKVVLHHQTHLRRSGPPRVAHTLARLAEGQPRATRYAVRLGGRVFLGATPERLVGLRGRAVKADVLAGSLPREHGARASELLASPKDRGEHELTRRAIVAALAPLCSSLHEDGPHVRALPHLFHLSTRVRGTLARPRHVLDLVGALHPTPAVSGVPRDAALALLAAEERPRLWYAGPIGWFAPRGDGDFRVALRCALIDEHHATLYAGAGIVAASDPLRETAEIACKERAMRAALGIGA